jgi:hypothetical protein
MERDWEPSYFAEFIAEANRVTGSSYINVGLFQNDMLEKMDMPKQTISSVPLVIVDPVKYSKNFKHDSKFIFKFRYYDDTTIFCARGIFNIPHQSWILTTLTETWYDSF